MLPSAPPCIYGRAARCAGSCCCIANTSGACGACPGSGTRHARACHGSSGTCPGSSGASGACPCPMPYHSSSGASGACPCPCGACHSSGTCCCAPGCRSTLAGGGAAATGHFRSCFPSCSSACAGRAICATAPHRIIEMLLVGRAAGSETDAWPPPCKLTARSSRGGGILSLSLTQAAQRAGHAVCRVGEQPGGAMRGSHHGSMPSHPDPRLRPSPRQAAMCPKPCCVPAAVCTCPCLPSCLTDCREEQQEQGKHVNPRCSEN